MTEAESTWRRDLAALAAAEGVDLPSALAALRALYDDVDARNARNTATLDLPCHRGCSKCCEDSVLLTPLEFIAAWDELQRTASDETIAAVVARGLDLYDENRDAIEALDRPPPAGEQNHARVLATLAYRCPLLDEGGACRVYPWREMSARLFGSSFNDEGGVYGCGLVGAHLGGRVVTLVRARPMAMRVHTLPLSSRQQVYPHYIRGLYRSPRFLLAPRPTHEAL